MATDPLFCWKCGATLAELPLPLSRLAECAACHAYVHVCRMCRFFDPHAPKQCSEQDAEEVKEKERPNFCDYFRPTPNAYRKDDPKSLSAKSKLDTLFSGSPGETENKADVARGKLDKLFGKGDK